MFIIERCEGREEETLDLVYIKVEIQSLLEPVEVVGYTQSICSTFLRLVCFCEASSIVVLEKWRELVFFMDTWNGSRNGRRKKKSTPLCHPEKSP
jgi:hypothetical protein